MQDRLLVIGSSEGFQNNGESDDDESGNNEASRVRADVLMPLVQSIKDTVKENIRQVDPRFKQAKCGIMNARANNPS